ncbi:hypothetical protein KAT08_01740 [Candidatus Babeliales bacterium]|nr:hypothetical protein [Candidatus Babeliales bacterium]
MKIIRNIIFSCVISLLVINYVNSVSENSASRWGIGVGGTISVACLLLSLGAASRASSGDIPAYVLSALAGTGFGALVGYLLYKTLLYNTSRARFLRAKKNIEDICCDGLISRDFENIRDLIKYVNVRFESSWPLVLAKRCFIRMRSCLKDSSDLLCMVYDEAKNDKNLKNICKKCKKLDKKIDDILKLIEDRIVVIIEHRNYNFQVSLYQKHEEEERKRRQRERESMMKLQMHQDKIRQKERERQQKEDFLMEHYGNVNVTL